jgi:hypothetical protein
MALDGIARRAAIFRSEQVVVADEPKCIRAIDHGGKARVLRIVRQAGIDADMANESVAQFMARLSHPRKDAIAALRTLVLAADTSITERVKWKAPSFCANGDDRVTMCLAPGDVLQLVFHRGAKAKDTTAFSFQDASSLIQWAAPDRGVVTLEDLADVQAKHAALTALVIAWIDATR